MSERLDEYFALAIHYHLEDLLEEEVMRPLEVHNNLYRNEIGLENFK